MCYLKGNTSAFQISLMNRIVFLIIFIFQLFHTHSSEHIKFLGLNVSDDMEQFKDSLIKKDFIYVESFESSFKLLGKFANEIVTLTVLATPKSKTVCKVIVEFPIKRSWQDLKNDYFAKKNLYKLKYTLDKDFEFFSLPYEEGDGYELKAVMRNKCTYASFFLAIGGYITVKIDETPRIKVTYEDKQNLKIAQQELEESAIDDI